MFPKLLGDLERLDPKFLPPSRFVAGIMQLAVMTAAKWDSEFIAHLEAKRSGLRKAEMMWVAGLAAADEAGL